MGLAPALSLATSGKLARGVRCGGSLRGSGAFYWLAMVGYYRARKPLKSHRSASGMGAKMARPASLHYGQNETPAIFSPGRLLYSV